MTRRSSVAILRVLIALAIGGPSSSALAAWGPDGVTVRPTTASIPIVAACTDGGSGTFVVWQEITSGSAGMLRVQHLVSTGDLDPAWPVGGALATTADVAREFADVVPDRQGGVYVCWNQGSSLYATHLDASGAGVSGWAATGKALGSTLIGFGRPRLIEDGAHGIYVAWTGGNSIYVQRLGTDGLGAGGWPNMSRIVSPAGAVLSMRLYPDLALAPDGGIFVSWASQSSDTTQVESGLYLRRLTGAAVNAAGWPSTGVFLEPYRPEILGMSFLPGPLIDVSPDGRGGVFVATGRLYQDESASNSLDVRLRRLLGDGQPAAGWPVEGRATPPGFDSYWASSDNLDGGVRVHPDGQDGAIVERVRFPTDSPAMTEVSRTTDAGPFAGQLQVVAAGHDLVPKGDGGVFAAAFEGTGPSHPFDINAFIGLDQSNAPAGWTTFGESHAEPLQQWYGDIGLAKAGTNGVVFFWSQVRERFGLFARRFSTVGEVTGVPPPGGVGDVSTLDGVRYVRGSGVVARITVWGKPARLELFDVGGRRISSRTLDGLTQGATDVAMPGTASISSGLYFARLVSDFTTQTGKVAVVR
ncbi:MAG TPA: hypothetical protein VJY35_00845 [Candidatus Eisenbacteria bacterium]|nr:hypothetical protein [Candidatus Eisenbacteria bacterium]